MQPRAVIFDIGNTLWFEAVRRPPPEVYALQARAVGPLLDEFGIAPVRPLTEIIADVWSAVEAAYDIETSRATYRDPSIPYLWEGALAAQDIDITTEQAERIWRAAWVSPLELGVQLYPDTLDVLRALRAHGVGLCVNTNRPCTSEMLGRDLGDVGLDGCFDALVCSGDVGFFKPHPAPFERALELLGVDAGHVVMVGDGERADIGGAKALGMRTVWKLNGRYGLDPSPDADATIHDLGELLGLRLFEGIEHVRGGESTMPHEDANEDRY